jgi:hypothetical protein
MLDVWKDWREKSANAEILQKREAKSIVTMPCKAKKYAIKESPSCE